MKDSVKWIYAVILTICMSLTGFSGVAFADDTSPVISGSAVEAKAGEVVDVTLTISNNPGITAVILNVGYDADVMELTAVKDGRLMEGASLITSPSMAYNPYRLIWNVGTADVTANGNLVTLSFKVNENAKAGAYEINLSYLEDDIYNTALENVKVNVVNPVINVQSGVDEEFLLGDVNDNGNIELSDAQMALKAALKIVTLSDTEKKAADIDADGIVELSDAQLILKRALKIINSFDN